MGRLKLWFAFGLALMLAACATGPSVMTDYDTGYDFASLESVRVVESQQTGNDNIMISPFTFDHLHRVISNQLDQRYRLVEAGEEADFEVRYHIVIEERLDVRSYDQRYGFGYYGFGYHRHPYAPFASPRVYSQGNLIIDMVDGDSGEPIWRGVAEERLYDKLDPRRQRKILSGAVADILSRFPPIK